MFPAFNLNLMRRHTTSLVLGAAALAALAGCGSDKGTDAKVESKFPVPQTAQQSPPDINTVPSTAPTPRSTADERQKATEGLVADRDNARHSDQGARSMPVAVRPLSDTPPPAAQATPPIPAAVPAAAVARLSDPAPTRPAEASGPAPAGSAPVSGPRLGGQPPTSGGQSDAGVPRTGVIYAAITGFRSVATFDAGKFKNTERMAQLSVPKGNLSTGDRNILTNAATKQAERKGVIRVIGHGDGDLKAGQEKAAVVARELQRLGVTENNLYAGADQAAGSTEVILHY